MVRTFLKVYMELGSYFLFLQEQIKDIIIIYLMRGEEYQSSDQFSEEDKEDMTQIQASPLNTAQEYEAHCGGKARIWKRCVCLLLQYLLQSVCLCLLLQDL